MPEVRKITFSLSKNFISHVKLYELTQLQDEPFRNVRE